MTEQIQKLLSESKTARWTALFVVSFTMLCGYFLADVMAPLKPMLESMKGWNSEEYGFFTSAYGWFNVFLFMLLIGGIILDKLGVRFTGLMAASIMVAGTAIKYYAISTHSLDGLTLFGWKAQVMVAALGYAIFGVGVEVVGITATKIIVKWFRGKELALAMGLQVATARIGTMLALLITLPFAKYFNSVSAPILLCLILLCIGLMVFFLYTFMDKKLDKSVAASQQQTSDEDAFRLSDILLIIKNKGFWYIGLLCVLFYSSVFPFIKYATDLMIQKFGVDEAWAGSIPAMLPFGTLVLTPLFGSIYDRKGRGASLMILGSFLIVLVHGIFSIPALNHWFIAILLMIVLGIGFSLVPSAMWPSVPKIIPEKQLGTAYATIFWIQNWGLMGVPYLIGWVLEKYCITGELIIDGNRVSTYDYTYPMLIFTAFGILAVFVAYLLKAEDKKKGYGLELPNIKK